MVWRVDPTDINLRIDQDMSKSAFGSRMSGKSRDNRIRSVDCFARSHLLIYSTVASTMADAAKAIVAGQPALILEHTQTAKRLHFSRKSLQRLHHVGSP